MQHWRYYVSGICYGIFKVTGEGISYSWLDVYSGEWSPFGALCDEENEDLKKWSQIDVLKSLSQLQELEKEFLKGEKNIVTSWGERYVKRSGGIYVQKDKIYPVDCMIHNRKLISFLAPSRESIAVFVREGEEQHTVLHRWKDISQKKLCVSPPCSVDITMEDGVILKTDVYLPVGLRETCPAILIRTPYGKRRNAHMYYKYVQRGYAVVIQDVRGREESGGEFIPNYFEEQDGSDTLDWIAEQNWCNGKVGMFGGSYLGYVQWAAYASGNPHLKAIVSLVTSGGGFADIPRRGGCFVSGMMAWAFAMAERTFRPENMSQSNWDELLNIRPIGDIPKVALGKNIPFIDTWLEHPNEDEFWKKGDWHRSSPRFPVPALILSGWFDDNSMGTSQALDLTKGYSHGERKVVLGPWNHNGNTRYSIHDVDMGTEALRYDLDLLYLNWFDEHLKGLKNGVNDTLTVEYYTLGENKWKISNMWPPENSVETALYLGEDGLLLSHVPELDGCSSYEYDPHNPPLQVIDMSENEIGVPGNYTDEEKRPDVLVYTTEPLEESVTISGGLYAELYVSSDAPETDFVVRLCEVDEIGCSIRYSDGVLNAKYHSGFHKPEVLKPGQVYRLKIHMTNLSKQFAKGNRIRVTIASGAKNFIFPNSNTIGGYESEDIAIANNSVWYGKKYPSKFVFMKETVLI